MADEYNQRDEDIVIECVEIISINILNDVYDFKIFEFEGLYASSIFFEQHDNSMFINIKIVAKNIFVLKKYIDLMSTLKEIE